MMLDVWLRVLEVLDRLMNSGQQHARDQIKAGAGPGSSGGKLRGEYDYGGLLEEQIPESLKNILLVMADAGYLVPPTPSLPTAKAIGGGEDEGEGEKQQTQADRSEGSEKIWQETRRRVERFLPGLFAELFPEQQQQQQQQPPLQAEKTQPQERTTS